MELDRRKFFQFCGAASAATASTVNDIVNFQPEVVAAVEPVVEAVPQMATIAAPSFANAALSSMNFGYVTPPQSAVDYYNKVGKEIKNV